MNTAVQPAQTANTAPLLVEGIHKKYGDNTVLDNVSLELNAGEIYGLIGLNGVGKTTLIKIMLDLTKADAGTIHLSGELSTDVASRRHMSYLPEKFQPSRYLKGFEYLSLSLSYYGKKLNRDEACEMAKALDLDPKALGRKVGSYSKGMGQKLGLVGAFLIDQPFLVLDEPMSGLDPRARIHLKDMMLKMKTAGKTIFFSSHILSDIDEICERIGVIHDTKLSYTGTPAGMREKYKEASLEKAFLRAINVA